MSGGSLTRLLRIEILQFKKNKDGHTEYVINAYFSDSMTPVQFTSRYSCLLDLHKVIAAYNKKDGIPIFPGKNIFGTKTQDLIQKRQRDINEYYESILKNPQLGGHSIMNFFVQNDNSILKEYCQKLCVKNRIELYKYYPKEKRQFETTFNSKAYRLIRENSTYMLKKYGLDEDIRDSQSIEQWRTTVELYSQRMHKLKVSKHITRIEQIFINHDPSAKCKCKTKDFYTKLWIVTPFYESTLEQEINYRFKNKKPFSSYEVLDVLKQVMTGLELLYCSGLYHRNVKPTNIGIVKEVLPQKQYKTIYVLMDYQDMLLYRKEKNMTNGNANTNRYSINLAYKSPRRVSQIRQLNNSKNRDDDYKNFDMYALGIILLQLCLTLPTTELQGFQETSQLREDMIDNYLIQIKQKFDESIFEYITILLNKAVNLFANQSATSSMIQKPSTYDIVYSKLFAKPSQRPSNTQMSPLINNNDQSIVSTKALSEQSTTYGNSAQDIESQQKSGELDQPQTSNLDYADECFILKYHDTNIPLSQKKTQRIFRVLLSECDLDNDQVKDQFKCVKDPQNFRGYAAISLAKNNITNDLGDFMQDLIISLEYIDSLSIDLRSTKDISGPFILSILKGVQLRKSITKLLVDISECSSVTPECINAIIQQASQLTNLFQFSLYFYNSNLNEESLQQLELHSKQFKQSPLIKFMYTF